MPTFDIVGDVLSDKQHKYVCNVLENLGFNGNKVVIETVGKLGDNYSANVKRIIVEKNDGTAFKMIAKVAPTNEFLRKSVGSEAAFGNEAIMYDEILPTFRQLEIDTGVPEEDRYLFPVCYGIYLEELHEIILLEDLHEKNFIMPDRFKTLKDEEVTLVVQKLAKLHSLSYLLRTKDPAKYKTFTAKLSDYFASDSMTELFNYALPAIIESINTLLDNEKYKNVIRDVLGKYIEEIHKIKEFDTGSEYNVVIHGDAWINNILMKPVNDIFQECILIDYQLSYERSPVGDLHYFINCSTDYPTRSKHYHEWIDTYHEELRKRLAQFGLQVNNIYPKDKLKDDLIKYANVGFSVAILLAHTLSMNTDDAARMKDTMNTVDLKDVVTFFRHEHMENSTLMAVKLKVEALIDSFYDLGYFN